jgi:hypothetical protein
VFIDKIAFRSVHVLKLSQAPGSRMDLNTHDAVSSQDFGQP